MVTPRVLPLQRLEVEIGFMFYQTTHWERTWHSMKCLKFFLGFFKGFVNFFQFFGCLLFHFFKGIFHFLFKGHHHFDKVKFKVVFFCFFQIRLLSLPIVCPLGSGVTLLNFTLWRNCCIGQQCLFLQMRPAVSLLLGTTLTVAVWVYEFLGLLWYCQCLSQKASEVSALLVFSAGLLSWCSLLIP